ncbi:discoidin domain-containing protein [Pedobacter gandavensis]|uniref:discoidin domain-containing protein n=1 Tax=Pedobacter gandavensis TaxID=2679963 RepID=UPI002931A865|nr:discoidin domain-containing protein [Pedobacter gandavensis]
MNRKGFYLLMLFAATTVSSCKKDKVIKEIEPVIAPVVVVEDQNYLNVSNTVEISPVLNGAKFDWQNDAKKSVDLKFKYVEDGLNKEVILKNNKDAVGTFTVPISGLTNFSILVSNTDGKAVATRSMGVLPILKPEVKLTKTGWTATASSEINDVDDERNGAENIVDDIKVISLTSPGTPSFWQSDYNLDPIFPYPHWLMVDIKEATKLTKIGLNAHTDPNQGFTSFKIEGSVNGIDFTDIGGGQLTFNPATTKEQMFPVSSSLAIRYVKVTLLIGSPYPCLANFEAYSRK